MSELDETRALYEARLKVFETAARLCEASVTPQRVSEMIDVVEARLLSANLQRCFAVAMKEDGKTLFFAGWAGPYPAWSDSARTAIAFARQSDASEFIETLPLDESEGRERMFVQVIGGPL